MTRSAAGTPGLAMIFAAVLLGPSGAAAAGPPAPPAAADGLAEGFALAIDLAIAATRHQAIVLGVDLGTGADGSVGHDLPSDALLELAARHSVRPTPAEREALLALDELPGSIPRALARTVDAFLAFDESTARGFGRVTAADFEALEGRFVGANPFAAVGVDVGPVLASRIRLLEASRELRDALAGDRAAPGVVCETILLAPAFSIDLTSCENHYVDAVSLQIDAGGADTYLNTAGGSRVHRPHWLVGDAGAAALLDLGPGDDVYGAPGLGFGQNGGGKSGSGFLLEESGNSRYVGGSRSVNGGGNVGLGFLLDVSGHDRYEGGEIAVNGGGNLGAGLLLDMAGDDSYVGDRTGVNGGASLGMGLLLDGSGNDSYFGSQIANGAGFAGGIGALLDIAGDDVYVALYSGNGDSGLLVDFGGYDSYSDARGSGIDQTVAPKGFIGAQIDLPLVPPPVVPIGLVPTGPPVLGPDADRDGVPRYIDFPRSQLTLGGAPLVALTPGSPVRAFLDDDDSNPCVPWWLCPSASTPAYPSGGPVFGPDGDRDGLPAYVEFQRAVTTARHDGTVQTSPAGATRTTIDPDDADACSPACPSATFPTGASFGPDSDGDGLPAFVEIHRTEALFASGEVRVSPAHSLVVPIDPADDDADVGTPHAAVSVPPARVAVGAGRLGLACAGISSAETPTITLEGVLAVPARPITEPSFLTGARCAGLAAVPRST